MSHKPQFYRNRRKTARKKCLVDPTQSHTDSSASLARHLHFCVTVRHLGTLNNQW